MRNSVSTRSVGAMAAAIVAVAMTGRAQTALGQSLNERPAPAAPARAAVAPVVAADSTVVLRGVSLFVVATPPPKMYQKNDLVEIIVNEASLQKHQQSLDTLKNYTSAAELSKFPSLRNLIELQLRNGDSQAKANLDVTSKNRFKGNGQYERRDNFTARITAVVLEVKPNGTLVLEARKSFTSNKEETALVMSGVCRPDDITLQNTVQSSQLANLTLTVRNEGEVKDAAKKGFIPQVLETIFNF